MSNSKRTLTQTKESELDFSYNASTTKPSKFPRLSTSTSASTSPSRLIEFPLPPPSLPPHPHPHPPPSESPFNNMPKTNTNSERATQSRRLCQDNTRNTEDTRGASSMWNVDNDDDEDNKNDDKNDRILQPRHSLSQDQNPNQNQDLPLEQSERMIVRLGEDGRQSSSSSGLQSRSTNQTSQRLSSTSLVVPMPVDSSFSSSSSSPSPLSSSSPSSSPPSSSSTSSSTSSSSNQCTKLHAMLGKQKYKSEVYKEQLTEQRRRNKELEHKLAETSKQFLQAQGRDDAVHLHAETKIISLSKELKHKDQHITALTAQTTHLQSQIQDSRTESRTQITRLQNTQTALSKKLQESHAQVTHLRHVVMTGNTEKRALEEKLRALGEKLHASEEKLCELKENLRTSEQNLHASAEKLHTAECARKYISNELIMQVNANMHLSGEIKDMGDRVRFLERENDGFRVELDRRMRVVGLSGVNEGEGEVGVGVLESLAAAGVSEEEQVVGDEVDSLFGV
ncbi:hypothetical protein C8R41DRAFT_828344 [Lentinula lateritia]|uniref:Uncharacterized protein n=1 Tax=Lentinula lateritia TaxID=40482 RepID=A0ABQ8VHW7_9AGAR|nr:hypothetical protein C8R41DRAFT_828344 [Lentinula lateritia]